VQRHAPRTAWTGSSNTPAPTQFYYDAVLLSQLLTTSGHAFRKLGKSKGDIGGDFKVTKQYLVEGNSSEQRHIWTRYPGQVLQAQTEHYLGPVFAHAKDITPSSFPVVAFTPNASIDAMGATAIKNLIPTNPIGGLATFIGEAREGIPKLYGVNSWKNRTSIARSAGGEYLNHQFGWLPLVSDVQKFSYAVRNHDKIIAQYERDSGKRIKRRMDFPVSRTTSVNVSTGNAANPVFNTNFYDGANGAFGTKTTTTTTTVETWFSGCFSYYLPPYNPSGSNAARNEQIANKLFGTRPTPEVFWNVTPWTWALDWVGNMGDVIHNASAFLADGLVMPYAYMMQRKTTSIKYELTGIRFRSVTGPTDFFQEFVTVTKSRRAATPYGFGLNIGGFSAKQWAILGAIGLTRGDRSLSN
jgi:hypothetical protein